MNCRLILLVFVFNLFNVFGQNTAYLIYEPCSFKVELPSQMKMSKMYEDENPDYCDYEVKLNDDFVIMELHSLVKSQFEYNTIEELYNAAVNASELNITYKTVSNNFFVISGFNLENGNIVYWKRALGENYISDLYIEYNTERKKEIEPFLGKISKSFSSY